MRDREIEDHLLHYRLKVITQFVNWLYDVSPQSLAQGREDLLADYATYEESLRLARYISPLSGQSLAEISHIDDYRG